MAKAVFVTNFCPHYRVKAFELLAKHYDMEYFFFSDASEDYWEKKNRPCAGGFRGEYLKGFYLFPKFKVSLDLIKKLWRGDFDIFIKCVNGRFALPVTFLIARLKRKPFILWQTIWEHPRTLFHRFSFRILRWIWAHTDAFVVYGDHGKEYLTAQGIRPEKIFIAYNTMDNSLFERSVGEEEIRKLRKDLNIGNKKVVLFVGRLEVSKGVYDLLNAFEKVRVSNSVLVLAGDGREKQTIQALCIRKRWDNVVLPGYIDNSSLVCYYALADIFVLPSITTRTFKEPWGLVINEAMNQGCPVVATRAVGAAVGGLVCHGANGLVVREKDPDCLAGALRTLLVDDALCRRMGEKSKSIIQEWTYEKMVKGFLDAIDFVGMQKIKREKTADENSALP